MVSSRFILSIKPSYANLAHHFYCFHVACWARWSQCLCEYFGERKRSFYSTKEGAATTLQAANIHILSWYHQKELGRTANTAHIYEELCGPAVCTRIVYGDEGPEAALIEDIIREAETGQRRTAVLFPRHDAVPIGDFYQELALQQKVDDENDMILPPLRLVAIESSYSKANRMVKLIENAVNTRGVAIPLAKLGVKEGEVLRSAFHGVQRQPAPDKVSTFQAVVMSLRQCAERFPLHHAHLRRKMATLCDHLDADLTAWMTHLLREGVKKGKVKESGDKWNKDLPVQEEFKEAIHKYQHPDGKPVFRVYERYHGKEWDVPNDTTSVYDDEDFGDDAREEDEKYSVRSGRASCPSSRQVRRELRRAVQVALQPDGSLRTVALACHADGQEVVPAEDYYLTLRKSRRFRVLGLVPVKEVVVEVELHKPRS